MSKSLCGGWEGGGGWVLTHNLVKPTLLVKVELGFDNLPLNDTHSAVAASNALLEVRERQSWEEFVFLAAHV